MENQMICFANGRFCNPKKIIEASYYTKDGKIRVAITLNDGTVKKHVVYSDVMEDQAAAIRFISALPI
jgi:hypothetical protein